MSTPVKASVALAPTRCGTALPIRRPTFQNKDPGNLPGWVVRNWPTEPITEKPVNKWRASFAILFLIAGYLDNGIDDPTVRELNAITKLGNVRIVRLIDQLEANGWISVERGDDAREERNHYRINAD